MRRDAFAEAVRYLDGAVEASTDIRIPPCFSCSGNGDMVLPFHGYG